MSTQTVEQFEPLEDDFHTEEEPLDELSREFVERLIDKVMQFMVALVGHDLHLYQKPFARRLIESVIINDGEEITALAARQALALDTPLLTPDGWTTIGEVEVGDYVFAPSGMPVRIKDASQVFEDNHVYEISFSDGQTIIADAEHRWYVYDRLDKTHKTIITDELFKSFRGTDDRFSYRYAIQVTAPLDYPGEDLPIDPYILGAWLGDGSTYKAEITSADKEIVQAFRDAGYETTYEYNRGLATTYGFKGLCVPLKALGVIKNKHIPDRYFTGSVSQRLALLQGLMDTDGHATLHGEVEFCTIKEELAEAVLFIVRSLGWKATLRAGRATINGKDCGPKYRVTWTPYGDGDLIPFRLDRKVERLKAGPIHEFRRRRTASINVINVVPVDPEPTRCIAVDDPSEMFLAGHGLLPTKNSGKSETIANVVSTLMVLMPLLAKMYPDLLGKYKDGLWVGMFAPVEGQAETLFGRTVSRLTSERANEILGDPEIDDMTARTQTKTRGIRLKKSGSMVMMMTANPRAQIESKSFHLIIIDECQAADDFVVNKSIMPMGAYYNATKVKTGTPTTSKNNFYKSIQLNKRRQTGRNSRQNHFQWDWKEVAKVNKNYETFIKREKLRIGEDSDEFVMSYACAWLLERGMFVTSSIMDELGDTSMETVKSWVQSPVVVGIDPARKVDSTVITVVWVDWDRPDEFGYFDHRVLNWLEIQGDDWEEQYAQIVAFLSNYDVLAVGVDAQGVGDAVAQRLRLLLPRAEVISVGSNASEQSKRWKHLQALIQRKMIGWPAHAKTRRLRTYKRFIQQCTDLEIRWSGPNFLAAAPDEAHAHDDYADSLAIACSLTMDQVMPTIEVSRSPFF